MKNKEHLLIRLRQLEGQLVSAQRESNIWKTGKYKNRTKVEMLNLLIKSCNKEISDIQEQLSKFN